MYSTVSSDFLKQNPYPCVVTLSLKKKKNTNGCILTGRQRRDRQGGDDGHLRETLQVKNLYFTNTSKLFPRNTDLLAVQYSKKWKNLQ